MSLLYLGRMGYHSWWQISTIIITLIAIAISNYLLLHYYYSWTFIKGYFNELMFLTSFILITFKPPTFIEQSPPFQCEWQPIMHLIVNTHLTVLKLAHDMIQSLTNCFSCLSSAVWSLANCLWVLFSSLFCCRICSIHKHEAK